jgi:hypothetical protein
MAEQDSTTQTVIRQEFPISEYDDLNLKISRAHGLADVLQLAFENTEPEPGSLGPSLAMLFELLSDVKKIWTGATSRRELGKCRVVA